MAKTTKNGYFAIREKEENPICLVTKKHAFINIVDVRPKEISGRFFRVIPTTSREIMALNMMEHQYEKYAPAFGDGVIISEAALQKLDAMPKAKI